MVGWELECVLIRCNMSLDWVLFMNEMIRRILKKITVLKAFTLLAALWLTPAHAAVQASLTPNPAYVGDSVTLTITVDGSSSGKPDLSGLRQDFRVLGSGSSSNIQVINGVTHSSHSWTITLKPLKKGQLKIPPIPVGSDKTQPLSLTVQDIPASLKAKLRDHVTLEVTTADGQTPVYVQQQIPLTVKLYTDDSILSGELLPPEVKDAVVEQVTRDKQYTVTRNGKTYRVLERRYVVSPQRSGKLTIPPIVFRGEQRQPQRQHRRRSFDDFFNDPFDDDFFAGTPFGPRGKPIETASEPLSIAVKPIPDSFHGNQWLPAERVLVSDSWASKPPRFQVGEPVVRELKLQVKGQAGSQIPAIDPQTPAKMKIYSDQNKVDTRTDGETVFGISQQKFTYIPAATGKVRIPAITIDWWNTRTDKPERTILPARSVEILPGTGNRAVPASTAPANTKPAMVQPSQANVTSDTQQAEPSAPAVRRSLADWIERYAAWLALGLVSLAALMLFSVWRSRRAQRQQHGGPELGTASPSSGQRSRSSSEKTQSAGRAASPSSADRRQARQALHRACERGDAANIAKALLTLATAEWPDDPPRNLGALAERVTSGHEAIRQLDRFLYGAGNEAWQAAPLCEAFREGLTKADRDQKQEHRLGDLYPKADR